MSNSRTRIALAVLLVLTCASLNGPSAGAADPGHGSPNLQPVANLPHTGGEEPGQGGGTDIEFATIGGRDIAFAGTLGRGLQIVDVTSPASPQRLAVYDCKITQGDVQVFNRDGRWLLTYTSDYDVNLDSQCFRDAVALGENLGAEPNTGLGTFIVDVTNPAAPATVSFIHIPRGSHNQTVHPSGRYLYNSNADLPPIGGLPSIEYYDIADPAEPRKLGDLLLLTGLDAHDITFNASGTRAYVAALTHTLILDTTNPANPQIIGRIIDPLITIHHQADPVRVNGRDYLVVTDELLGAAGNGFCPGGGLHVFDITGSLERLPIPVGVFLIPEVRLALDNLICTSHVLRMYPEHGLMTIAWYDAGVRVIDISKMVGISLGLLPTLPISLGGMKEIAYYEFDNANTWSAKAPRINADGSFYLFGNDLDRGLDVYRFDATAPRSSATGSAASQWLSPLVYRLQAAAKGLVATSPPTQLFCGLRG